MVIEEMAIEMRTVPGEASDLQGELYELLKITPSVRSGRIRTSAACWYIAKRQRGAVIEGIFIAMPVYEDLTKGYAKKSLSCWPS